MNKIWIFGDSFASSKHSYAWTSLLSDYGSVVNEASNGSSEYRIWKKYQSNKRFINNNDIVIFCHTSPSRIFLKDTAYSLSRILPTHPLCDLIFGDVFAKNEKRFISVLKEIWDDEYFQDTYNMLVNDLKNVPNSIHLNFFEDNTYNNLWKDYPGEINHLNMTGNQLVFQHITKQLT